MKLILVFVAVLAFACSQETEKTTVPETAPTEPPVGQVPFVRDLPADVLRDFASLCFASTLCRVFEVGQSWELTPFCGKATCVLAPEGFLIERVEDCGLLPRSNPKCRIVNENAKNETFPTCCPVFECEEGVQLEYPTPEELQSNLNAQSESPSKAVVPEAGKN